jgi:hypothetical protein
MEIKAFTLFTGIEEHAGMVVAVIKTAIISKCT